ncbi:TolC family protein [Snodgrassella alvi]|uniref:TolC family protein n=1 Tax=Snodgrassella alvi TaxID=1196083 RepID=UPI000C1E1A6F|nr:TolC family protein [Snodgrassella alvi]PIT31423.1 type I secretion protein TolC [Snodgrassella alvi]PIT31870.1 type I secretion protein TolC [Snodgrassella alvi]WLT03864.1 TolC family protein [Snodgrassella alvi]
MQKYTFTIWKTFCICIGYSVISAPVQAFDLFDAWQAAINYSADFSAAQSERDAQKEQLAQTRAALLPQVNGNYIYQKQPPSLSSTTQTHGWNVQASQALFDKTKWAQYQQGKITANMADWQLENVKEDLLFNVAKAYFQVLLIEDKLVSIEKEKEAYAMQIRQSKALFSKGAATILDTNEAQAGYEAARAKKVSAMTDLLVAQNNLANITGLDPKKIKRLRHTDFGDLLGKTSKADWINTAQKNNPEWQQQKLALENAKQAYIAAKAENWPKLTINGGYQDNHQIQQFYGLDHGTRSKGGIVTVQLSMPLFTGGLIHSKIKEAAAKEQQNKFLLIATERKIELNVNQAYQTTLGNLYQIQAQQQLLKANSVKLEATQLGRKVGIRSNLDELQALQAKADAEQKLAEAQYGYITTYIQLLQSAGILTQPTEQKKLHKLLY